MIAVTGASGFLGTAVLNELTSAAKPGLAVARRMPAGATPQRFAQLDLAHDTAGLRAELEEAGATALVHLALVPKTLFDLSPEMAQSGVEQLDRTVIEACRQSRSLRTIVLVSSAAVYGDHHPAGFRISENTRPAPGAAYGRIKLTQEERWRLAKLPCPLVIVRVFNLIGPGEPTSFVSSAVAERLAKLSDGDALPIRSSESTRDFCDVRDVASALLGVAELGAPAPSTINICSGEGTDIRTLTQMMVDASGRRIALAPDNAGKESRSVGNPDLLRSLTGWRRGFSLEQSIAVVWSEHSRRPT